MDFYEAYHFLNEHEIFKGRFLESLFVEVVKVDSETNCVEDDKTRNTKTQIWFETGPLDIHDVNLMCGGDTFEEAIVTLAKLVLERYGKKPLKDRKALIRMNHVLW